MKKISMLQEIQLEDAECRFRELVEKSVHGDEFVILKNNRAVAKIIPYSQKKAEKNYGNRKGAGDCQRQFQTNPGGL